MKRNFYVGLVVVAAVISLCSCETTNDGRPIPGTLESTSTKNSANINNTPRTNPTPNPEPASNPPGPDSDRRVIITQ